jgi:hypothetical protein
LNRKRKLPVTGPDRDYVKEEREVCDGLRISYPDVRFHIVSKEFRPHGRWELVSNVVNKKQEQKWPENASLRDTTYDWTKNRKRLTYIDGLRSITKQRLNARQKGIPDAKKI